MKPRKEKGRLAPFVPLLKETLSTPAWRAMSHGSRSLYVALKQRYNPNSKNNGRLYLSTRIASAELGSNRDSVQRWYRELQHYGFIVMHEPGCLGVDGKGKAPHWRLTEIGYMNDWPTRNFLRWDGTKFKDDKKQKPGRESGAGVDAKPAPPEDAKAGPLVRQGGRETGSISAQPGGRETGSITSLTTRVARAGPPVHVTRRPALPPDDCEIPPFLRRGHPACSVSDNS